MNAQTRELAKEELKKQLDEIVVDKGYADDTPGRAKAFEWWIIKNILGIEKDEDIFQANVGDKGGSAGSGSEWECDFFTVLDEGTDTDPTSEGEQTMVWGQAKYSENFNYSFDDAQFSRLLRVEERLTDCPDSSNEKFKAASKKFMDTGGSDSRARKKIIIVVCGDVTQQVKEQKDDPDWIVQHIASLGGTTELVVYTTDDILKVIVLPETPDVNLKFVESIDDVIKKYDLLESENLSVIGHIHGGDLAELWDNVGDTLFLENPRRFLGRTGQTNREITKTLRDDQKKQRFWKLNNGITATCDSITEEGDHFHIKNLKIVNGQQTTQSVKDVWKEDPDNVVGVQVGLKIHRTVDAQERKDISTATNRQNALTEIELMDIEGEQETLHIKCNTAFGCKYYYEKQKNSFKNESSEMQAKVTTRRYMLKGETAIRFYAYRFDPHDAIKKGKRKIFNEDNPEDYKLVFFNKIRNPIHVQGAELLIDEPGKIPGVRDAKELILVHVFHRVLVELGTKVWGKKITEVVKWMEDGSDHVSDPRDADEFWLPGDGTLTDIQVNKRHLAVLSPEHVKYYVLHWIYLTLNSLPCARKIQIEDEIIRIFGDIRIPRNPIPDEIMKIGKVAVEFFMKCYDHDKERNWDKDDGENDKRPSPDYVKKRLAQSTAYPNLIANRATLIPLFQNALRNMGQPNASGDIIKDALESIVPANVVNP